MSVSQIPIQNLYYLLCYAWNQLDEGSLVDVSKLPSTELVDLFAIVLVKGVEHVARRGLERGYNPHEEELRGIRGRIDILSTARRFLLKHGRAACNFDELTTNTLANQIIKATLRHLARDPDIDCDNRSAVLRLARNLLGVDDIVVTGQSFRRIQLHGNNGFYRFLLNVCELIHGAWLVDQSKGHHRFRDFLRDERKMAYVFQYFVYNFLRIERSDLKVFREHISWKAESGMDPTLSLLPRMETDVSILAGDRKIIIDTKYYREALSAHYETEKLHSGNLFQLLSYLLNLKRPGDKIEGLLLYPAVDRKLDVLYEILGIPVRVKTINLEQPWHLIRDDLMRLVN